MCIALYNICSVKAQKFTTYAGADLRGQAPCPGPPIITCKKFFRAKIYIK